MNRRRVFQIVAVASAVVAYATVIVGGTVRSAGAGMGCGADWPLCNGSIIPDLSDPETAIEFSHRVVALSAGIVFLLTLVLAFLWYRKDKRILFLSVSSFLLVVAQALLGALTVQTDLSPVLVTAHLAVGTATFAAALALALIALMHPPGTPADEESKTTAS
ncbi:MAG: COX15/CtaA family protein [Thermoplasmata archaeon]